MRRLIFENVFQDYEFLDRKEELFNFLYSIGMDSNSDKSYADINKDGEKDTLMVHFNMGSVTVYVGLCNFSNGEFKYLLYVKSSEGIVLKPTFFDSVEEIENNVSPYIETAYDDTKLSYLGIENEKEYMPSKSEYNDMLNSAIDSQDWEEVRRIQNKYGKLYESMKKIIRLTESDLTRLIKRVIKESADDGEIDMSNLPNEIKDFVFRYGNVSSDATDEEIKDAARQANAHDFIMQLPQVQRN